MTLDEKVFIKNLWNNHQQFMRNKIGRLGVSKFDAEDVLIDCFLDLIKVKARLQEMEPNEIRAYISIAVRNHCQRWHYLNNRISFISLEDDTIGALSNAQMIEDDLIARMDTEYQTALLLNGLSDRDKLILFGHFIEGKTNEELAELLHCKKNSVRALLSRAKKNAKAILRNAKGEDSNG